MDSVTLELPAESEVHQASSSNAVSMTATTESGAAPSMLDVLELPQAETEQQAQQQEAGNEGESVLQLNLTGDSLQKFAKILHERGLQTAEDAIQYFYSLHSNRDTVADNSGLRTTQKRKIGRPKGRRSGISPTPEDQDLPQWKDPASSAVKSNQPGTVTVDGVRKSTRRRKNPYLETEFVPVPHADGEADSDASDGQDDWDLKHNGDENDYDDEDEDSQDDTEVIDIEGNRSPAGLPPDQLMEDDNAAEEIHVEVTAAVAGGASGRPIDLSYRSKTHPHSRRLGSKVKRSAAGKRLGRPRKRAKEAVLTEEEETTKSCNKCSETFETLSLLRSHKMSVHGRPGHPYFCEHCDYTAMFECDIKRHQLVHSKRKQHKCEICDFETNWERNMTLHMKNVHKDNDPWICDRCDLHIYNHAKVKQHQLSHNPNAQKCLECGLLFETLAKLEWHTANMHNKEKSISCEHCDYTGNSMVNLKMHLKNKHGIEERQREKQKRRKKRTQCDVCNKKLINEEQKEVHMQIHEENNRDKEKPYYCLHCDARCADINQMVRHRAIHSDSKPFECRHCDYKTRWKKDLKTHEMIHSGVKGIHCPHCNYSCYTRQRLRAHLIKHDDSRRFVCPLCNMAFKSKQALRMHTMYHTGDATYSCDMCDFRTVTEMRLKKHKLRHTDERNYSCNLCGKRFKQPHHVTQHRDIVHLGKPSYRERKRIALQQSAAEALGSLNTNDVNFSGQTLVVNDDGSTTILDLQAVTEPQRQEEPTQYVMVETPAGYQYVAVVIPESEVQPASNTTSFVTDSTQVTTDTNTLEDAQILLSHSADQGQSLNVYYTTGVTGENNQAVETLVALQPQ